MPYYYMKLHHDFLHDPKIGMLSDHLFRRVIEFFIMASEQPERDGYLPSIDVMCWLLQTSADDLSKDLADVSRTGIVKQDDGRWYVTNFVKRQASEDPTAADRMKRYRERNKSVTGRRNVTRNVTDDVTSQLRVESIVKNLDIDDVNTDIGQIPAIDGTQGEIYQQFQNEISMLTPILSEKIDEWIKAYPTDWIKDAIKAAVENNVRKPNYINQILVNWKAEGRNGTGKPKVDRKTYSEVH